MNILCVDDDADFLDLTATFLERNLPVATIHTATRIHDAYHLLETEPITCIVSDYEMPEQTGLEFLGTVRETYPDLPFILFTGKGSEEIASDAISAGVTDYLQKRGTEQYDRLSARIRHAIAEYQTEHELQERVKELTAIQQVTDVLSGGHGQSAGQLQQVVDYLPQSCQYPEHAVAHLSIDGDEFSSPNYESPSHSLSVHDVTIAGDELTLTIGYVTNPSTENNGDMFLSEEQELVNTILQLVTAYLDRQHVLSDLHEADQRLQLILENTTAAMYLKDTDGRYIFVNAEYERLFNLHDEKIIGRKDSEIHPAEMADEVGVNDRRVLETGDPLKVEERITIDGAERSYISLKVPARNDAGNVEGVFGVSTEITDRKEQERQLERLNHAIPQLLSAEREAEVAKLGVEAARDILDLQANAIHLYDEESSGLVPVAETDTIQDLVGELPTFYGAYSIAWRVFEDGTARAIDDVRDEPDVYNPETPIRSELHLPLGKYGVLIAGSTTPSQFDQQDETVGELLAAHIVLALDELVHEQELRERESELKQQNARLDEFSSMISHALRNPLNVAMGNLELYQETGDAARLEAVETSLNRIQELITDLSALARHGEPDDEPEHVSIADVAGDAWELLDTRSASLATDDHTIIAARSQLQALFENLFRNAIGHGGADVTVRVGPLENGFFVEDTDAGIPPEERESIFTHGYSTGYGGSGVGLSIINRIAEAHDWNITLTESPEGGARFEFSHAAEQ